MRDSCGIDRLLGLEREDARQHAKEVGGQHMSASADVDRIVPPSGPCPIMHSIRRLGRYAAALTILLLSAGPASASQDGRVVLVVDGPNLDRNVSIRVLATDLLTDLGREVISGEGARATAAAVIRIRVDRIADGRIELEVEAAGRAQHLEGAVFRVAPDRVGETLSTWLRTQMEALAAVQPAASEGEEAGAGPSEDSFAPESAADAGPETPGFAAVARPPERITGSGERALGGGGIRAGETWLAPEPRGGWDGGLSRDVQGGTIASVATCGGGYLVGLLTLGTGGIVPVVGPFSVASPLSGGGPRPVWTTPVGGLIGSVHAGCLVWISAALAHDLGVGRPGPSEYAGARYGQRQVALTPRLAVWSGVYATLYVHAIWGGIVNGRGTIGALPILGAFLTGRYEMMLNGALQIPVVTLLVLASLDAARQAPGVGLNLARAPGASPSVLARPRLVVSPDPGQPYVGLRLAW
jgi:hypothetical protein